MIEWDISSDIDDCLREVGWTFEREIPFALGMAINDTLFDVRRRIVESTWQKAFTVRNQRFPGLLFRVGKVDRGDIRMMKMGADVEISGSVFSRGDIRGGGRPWVVDHAIGGTKTPKGNLIAIPTDTYKETMRAPTGRMRAPNKPMQIVNKKDHFLENVAGRKKFIKKRVGDTTEIVYVFSKEAEITPTFRFFPDSYNTAGRVMPRYFGTRLAQAVSTSRFY